MSDNVRFRVSVTVGNMVGGTSIVNRGQFSSWSTIVAGVCMMSAQERCSAIDLY